MNRWISIKDKYPKYLETILVTDGKEIWMQHGYYLGCFDSSVTHWSLPKLPKK